MVEHVVAEDDALARCVWVARGVPEPRGIVAIVSAGTSDGPVVREVRIRAELLGTSVVVHEDVGVAGVHRLATALPDVRIVGVEPELSNALTAALEAGRPVPVTPTSIADGLNAPFAGELPLRIAQERGITTVPVEEEEIEGAMRLLYERAKLACEPAGAAAVAALMNGRVPVEEDETAVCVVTGGNVAAQTAAAILAQP